MALNTEDLYALSRIRNLGPKTLREINRYARDLENPSSQELASCIIHCKLINSIKKANNIIELADLEVLVEGVRANAKRYLESLKKRGVSMISYNDPLYPKSLKHSLTVEIDFDKLKANDIFPFLIRKPAINPPYFLYYRGNIELLKKDGVVITGSSECTRTALKASTYLSEQFAKRGLCIISDLSLGCNSCFLYNLLESGFTKIIAIEALGIASSQNAQLAEAIVKNGGLVLATEFECNNDLKDFHLKERAKLEASLALGSIIIQTTPKAFPVFVAINSKAALKSSYVVQYNDNDTELSTLNSGNHFLVDNFKCKILKADRDPKIMQEIIENIVLDLKESQEHNLFSYIPELEDEDLIEQLEDLSAVDLMLYLLKKKGVPIIKFAN